jgi:hypothetical protein
MRKAVGLKFGEKVAALSLALRASEEVRAL